VNERKASSLAFLKYSQGIPELQNLPKRVHNGYTQPIIMTAKQVTLVIGIKAYSSIALKFREQHQAAILSMLPPSDSPVLPMPTYLSGLNQVVRVAGQPHTYQATAANYAEFQEALSSIQKRTGVCFNRDHRHVHDGMLVLKHPCFFGGKASFNQRTARMGKADFKRPKAAGQSIKCECPASITAHISLPYARSLKLTTLLSDQPASQPAEMDTIIRFKMDLGHLGHTPNSAADLAILPTDPRLVIER
jgi:hypothetical protein